jgi:hypothetical protein
MGGIPGVSIPMGYKFVYVYVTLERVDVTEQMSCPASYR